MNRTKHNFLYSFDDEYRKKHDFMQDQRKKFLSHFLEINFGGFNGVIQLSIFLFNTIVYRPYGFIISILIWLLIFLTLYCAWKLRIESIYDIVKDTL